MYCMPRLWWYHGCRNLHIPLYFNKTLWGHRHDTLGVLTIFCESNGKTLWGYHQDTVRVSPPRLWYGSPKTLLGHSQETLWLHTTAETLVVYCQDMLSVSWRYNEGTTKDSKANTKYFKGISTPNTLQGYQYHQDTLMVSVQTRHFKSISTTKTLQGYHQVQWHEGVLPVRLTFRKLPRRTKKWC